MAIRRIPGSNRMVPVTLKGTETYPALSNYITEGPYAPRRATEALGEAASDGQAAAVVIGGGLLAWWMFFRKDKEGWTRRERRVHARVRAREAAR